MALDFAYGRVQLSEIEIHGVRGLKSGRFTITGVTIDGQLAVVTQRLLEQSIPAILSDGRLGRR